MSTTVRRFAQLGVLLAAVGFGGQLRAAQVDETPKKFTGTKKFIARITLYNGRGDGFGKKTATKGRSSQHAVTAAADFRIIPRGSTVVISKLRGLLGSGRYEVIDTGTDVVNKKASKRMATHLYRQRDISREEYQAYRNAPVIDIFVDVSDRELDRLANQLPYFCVVET